MPPGARSTSSFVICAGLLLTSAPGLAAGQAAPVGVSSGGLRGLVHTGLPVAEREFNVSGTVGYGLTESFEPVPGAHQRGEATLGIAIAPWPFLAFSARVDGRLETHPNDGDGAHAAGFGDPRLFARGGHALSRSLSLGAELGVWFPGTEAPSLVPEATSAEARALFAFTPPDSAWAVLLAAGFRLDNSGQATPDLRRLRVGDRITLGLSDSNAVLAALGVARRFGDAIELFVEGSADLLVGADAPELPESPLRAAIGGRYALSRALTLDLTVIGSLSQRPPIELRDPLVPIEPRVRALLAVRYSLDLDAPQKARSEPSPTPKPADPTVITPPPDPTPQFASVSGKLLDDRGEPLPDARIKLRTADGTEHDLISDGEGGYAFNDIPVGTATLEASASGFQAQSWEVDVKPQLAPDSRSLVPKVDIGVMRGLVRSFTSEPLRAQIVVRDKRNKTVASLESAEDGRFELELAPGNYKVTISATGFQPHQGPVKIEGNGVSILNVDLRVRK